MEHHPLIIAARLINLGIDGHNPLNHQQIQKLAYYCHAWSLAIHHQPLLSEPVEAWRYGPIIPEIYSSLRKWRSDPIRKRTKENSRRQPDAKQENIIRQVYEKYGTMTGTEIAASCIGPGTPWRRTKAKHPGMDHVVIPDPVIEDYYAGILANGWPPLKSDSGNIAALENERRIDNG